MKHHEFTLFKKEAGSHIIRMMFMPLMPNIYKKLKGSKRFLVIKYPKTIDKNVPRKGINLKAKKAIRGNRQKFIDGWTDKWWFDNGQKAADKFNSL